MYMFVFLSVLMQVGYHEEAPMTLEVAPFSFEQVVPTPSGLLICDQEKSLVHVFDPSGKRLASLGDKGGAESLTLPSSANWLPERKKFYVYDGAVRKFLVWDAQYAFVEAIDTSFPTFFEVGPLIEGKGGFFATVSLTAEDFLLGHFGERFDFPTFGYKINDTRLKKMAPSLYRAYAASISTHDGPKILAVQALSNTLTILDQDLNAVGSVPLISTSWQSPEFGKLEKVAKNPRELEKLANTYSEVVGLQALAGSLFVAGFRNVLDGNGFYFQAYDATTGAAVGQTYRTAHRPMGSGHGTIYLKATGSGMKLIPIKVK